MLEAGGSSGPEWMGETDQRTLIVPRELFLTYEPQIPEERGVIGHFSFVSRGMNEVPNVFSLAVCTRLSAFILKACEK